MLRDAVSDSFAYLNGDSLGSVQNNNCEFLSPQSPEQVLVSQATANTPCERRQHLVPARVPECVIDGLEMIDVDHQNGDGFRR